MVAPPINKGIFIANLSISLATKIISSREGVMSPDRPIMSRILKERKQTGQWKEADKGKSGKVWRFSFKTS